METIITVMAVIGLVWAYYKYKKKIGQELIVAALISALWVSNAGIYEYMGQNNYLLGINLFPLIAWTAGLVVLREIYDRVNWNPPKFWKVSAVYVVSILALEFIFYNYFGIKITAGYDGLFGFELMHMPWWGQLYYLTIGPIYLKITDYLKVK